MAYSTYSSETLLKWLFTTDTVSRPTAWTVRLYDGDPENGGSELTDTDYVAQTATFTVADSDSNGRSEATNDAAVVFPAITDATVTVEYVVITDENDNILAQLQLDPARQLDVGNILSFPAGGIVIKGE